LPTEHKLKRIFIFADGTRNAFGAQESNIWRIYQALDLSKPEQIALYIPGVGTSGFWLWDLIDSATGLGVPANVRKLYRFLCWNWNDGVEIYMFGFSRGAFTIRTLIGLIASEGLVPHRINEDYISRTEMKRNVLMAWRAYRRQSMGQNNLIFNFFRLLRDTGLFIKRNLLRQRNYAQIQDETDTQGRSRNKDKIHIKYIGLFDTVEAYGVPFNEMRSLIDKFIWPVSFRNQRLSAIVEQARHALCLDDERVTFHPIRFDISEKPADKKPHILEVWFSGVHADVGGSYEDDRLAYIPLIWILKGAQSAGMHLRKGALDDMIERASPLAPIHDSRQGFGMLYRYAPRKIDDIGTTDSKKITDRPLYSPPLIHHSVAEKMVFGGDKYAPLMLPGTAKVLMPDETVGTNISGYQLAPHAAVAQTLREHAGRAVEHINKPNETYVDLTQDMVWWRQFVYILTFFAIMCIAVLPYTASIVHNFFRAIALRLPRSIGHDLHTIQQFTSAIFQDSVSFIRDILPSAWKIWPSPLNYMKIWLQAFISMPIASISIIIVTILIFSRNGILRDRIADLGRCIWFIDSAYNGKHQNAPQTFWSKAAHCLRKNSLFNESIKIIAGKAVPIAALSLIGIAALVALDRLLVSGYSGAGAFCQETDPSHRQKVTGIAFAKDDFVADNPCWATGFSLEKGKTYILKIETTEPIIDGSWFSSLYGFTNDTFIYRMAMPFRRWWRAQWMQPIARIGREGTDEWTLQASNIPISPEFTQSVQLHHAGFTGSFCDKMAVDAEESLREQTRHDFPKIFQTTFRARKSGELFLFLNDAMPIIPFTSMATCLYHNNQGKAKVTLSLQP